MELILTDVNGVQQRMIEEFNADIDLAGAKTFEVTVPAAQYDGNMTFGSRVFVPGTEIGGIIGDIHTDTAEGTVSVMGYTWRGLLSKKIIRPPAGEDYKTVSGELNDIIEGVIQGMFGSIIRAAQERTGKTIRSYSFDRYTTVYDGLQKMLKKYGYKLKIVYQVGEPGGAGWAEIGAVPIVDMSERIELSQDSRLNFTIEDYRMGINHLIIGGSGELRDRKIIDLYVQGDGSIGTTQYFTGINERVEFFDYGAMDDTQELMTAGEARLLELSDTQTFRMNVASLAIDVDIGDTIGGRDYITGMTIKKPLLNKIITIMNGIQETNYEVEGENE